MSTKPQIELFLENESGTQQVAYPFVESDHVSLSNGMDIDTMIRQDVSMPTVTHEDLSFKVGVGDQDVSSAIVDSSVAEMTIKGQTYQNILPEPSTHVLTNNKEMFKVNEGLDPNVEIVDGVSKSAILKGQTLVNLLTYFMPNVIYLDSQYRIRFSDVGNFDKITIVNKNSKTIKFAYYTNNWRAYEIPAFNNVLVEIPKEVTGYNILALDTFGWDSTNYREAIDNIVLLHGDYTNQDIPYFEGMQSVQMPVLTTVGKNLLNLSPDTLERITINGSTGVITKNNTRCTTKYIKATPKDDLFLKRFNTDYKVGVRYYHNDNLVNRELNSYGSPITDGNIRVGSNDYYNQIRLIFTKKDDSEVTPQEVSSQQIMLTNSRDDIFEPYKTNILSCQLAPLNQSMFEQGTFAESTPPNTQSYESIKLGSEHLYTTRIRTKGTYKVVQGATYEVQLNDGYGIFVCYCKNGLYSATVNRWLDGTRLTFTVPNDCDEMFFALRKTDNSAITPSDYPLIGLKIHQEVVLRSLPNGVKDTLNLNTGEYVQRIGEVVLDGSENWVMSDYTRPNHLRLYFTGSKFKQYQNVINSRFPDIGNIQGRDVEGVYITNTFDIQVEHSRLSEVSVVGFKQWLSQNPITVQYQLKTESIKTVDLSTSGNWEKIVLDGTQTLKQYSGGIIYYGIDIPNIASVKNGGKTFSDKILKSNQNVTNTKYTVQPSNTGSILCLSLDGVMTKEEATQYLSENPITIWYQTTTHQDSTQVKQPIFFKDGHIIQSSGAENSLIPTLDYQAKTSNSYVMDLMKTNTRYTMKAKSTSGTFTIDGTSYGAGTNGTFTTPSSMTNKLLVMSNKTNEEVMILEGDVTSKTIPYFKGIKSAFKDEDKIEVLSQNKNLLWNLDANNPDDKFVSSGGGTSAIKYSSDERGFYTTSHRTISVTVKPNTKYTLSVSMKDRDEGTYDYRWLLQTPYAKSFGSSCKEWTRYSATFTTDSTGVVRVNIYNTIYFKDMMLEECSTMTDFDLCETNTTKIPLLSPLRSLPNGVRDEVIIDRENHKAKIIQRVGETTLNGSENWDSYGDVEGYYAMQTRLTNCKGAWGTCYSLCDKLRYNAGLVYDKSGKAYTLGAENDVPNAIYVCLPKSELTSPDAKGFKQWMRDNTPVVTYRLATPVITEIDLEGYPYIYKDGHIFLNTDIAPTSEITYSINQQQQIEASNEDLMRHEKKITNLHKLIGTYVNVDYKNTLLSLNLELK